MITEEDEYEPTLYERRLERIKRKLEVIEESMKVGRSFDSRLSSKLEKWVPVDLKTTADAIIHREVTKYTYVKGLKHKFMTKGFSKLVEIIETEKTRGEPRVPTPQNKDVWECVKKFCKRGMKGFDPFEPEVFVPNRSPKNDQKRLLKPCLVKRDGE